MQIDRRALLTATAASLAASPLRAMAGTNSKEAKVRAALDSIADLPDPAAKLARLAPLSPTGLSHSTMLDLVTAREGLAVDARIAQKFPYASPGPYVVGPSSGAWQRAAAPDAAAGLAETIDRETARMRAVMRAGATLPRPFLDETVTAIEARAGQASAPVTAALRRQGQTLRSLRPEAGEEIGIWHLPGGDAYYPLLIERALGEPADAGAVHDRLMGEWRRLAAQADRLLARMGFERGSVGERFIAMFRDPRWHYADTPAGKDQAVAGMNAVLDATRARIARLIGPVPDFCLGVRTSRMSAADEAAGRGGYRTIAGPDTAGAYFVDLSDIARRPSWSLGSVVHHELLPGHMIQLPIEQQAAPHPLRLEYAGAFPEGWAAYAEALSADTGAFEDDVPKQLGYIHWRMFRIGRGIVDTGIHHARWSRDRALTTLRETQGEPAFFAPFESDIDRICLGPGIRAAEAMTLLRLGDLRHASMADEDDFAGMRRFHQTAVTDGRKRLSTLRSELSHQA